MKTEDNEGFKFRGKRQPSVRVQGKSRRRPVGRHQASLQEGKDR